jgi:hypothetical protein
MKKVINFYECLSVEDVKKSIKAGWSISMHKNKWCLENSKTIFIPYYMPKP